MRFRGVFVVEASVLSWSRRCPSAACQRSRSLQVSCHWVRSSDPLFFFLVLVPRFSGSSSVPLDFDSGKCSSTLRSRLSVIGSIFQNIGFHRGIRQALRKRQLRRQWLGEKLIVSWSVSARPRKSAAWRTVLSGVMFLAFNRHGKAASLLTTTRLALLSPASPFSFDFSLTTSSVPLFFLFLN